MKPGKELDAWIDEKVMQRSREHIYCERCEQDDYYTNMCLACGVEFQYKNKEACSGHPPYSTDLISALEVVKILQQRQLLIKIEIGEQCLVTIGRNEVWASSIDFVPGAICLAALKAFDVDAS